MSNCIWPPDCPITPIVPPTPRLYLCDGYLVDYVANNYWETTMFIDLHSVRTRVR